MTDTQRTSINIFAALAGAVGGYFYFKDKVKDPKILAAYCAGLGLVGFIAASQITKMIEEAENKPGGDQDLNEPDADPNWDATGTTNAIHDQTYNSWWDNFQGNNNLDAYDQCLMLSNTGLQSVYDDWLDRYWDEYEETLTLALQNDVIYYAVGNGADAISKRDSLINRLTYLGLS